MIDVPENVVKIDLEAVVHNLGLVRGRIPREAGVMAVVKADAYGHGAVPVARKLVEAGVEALAVARVPEAVELRRAGIDAPLFVLAGFFPEEAPVILDHDLTPMVLALALARALAGEAGPRGNSIRCVLKMDTGMGRLGVFYEQAEDALVKIKKMGGLEVIGLTTHLAQADKADKEFTLLQAERFARMCRLAETMGFELTANNITNSASVIDLPRLGPHLSRPGIMLYGLAPSDEVDRSIDLRPAMTFVSRVMQLKEVPAGTSVSYHRTWVADAPTRLAAVPIGYCHGFSRALSNKGRMLVVGRPAPIRGRVCMNTTMIDVTDIDGVTPGDEVVLIGRQGDEAISADEVAEKAGTINYEITCLAGGLNRREYV